MAHFCFFRLLFCCSVSCYPERLGKVETVTVSDNTMNPIRSEGNQIDIDDGINQHGHCRSINQYIDIAGKMHSNRTSRKVCTPF